MCVDKIVSSQVTREDGWMNGWREGECRCRWVTYSNHLVKRSVLFFVVQLFVCLELTLLNEMILLYLPHLDLCVQEEEEEVVVFFFFSFFFLVLPFLILFRVIATAAKWPANFPHSLSDKATRRASISASDRILEHKHTS